MSTPRQEAEQIRHRRHRRRPSITPAEAEYSLTEWRYLCWCKVSDGGCPYDHGALQVKKWRGESWGYCSACGCGCGTGAYYRSYVDEAGYYVMFWTDRKIRLSPRTVAKIREGLATK